MKAWENVNKTKEMTRERAAGVSVHEEKRRESKWESREGLKKIAPNWSLVTPNLVHEAIKNCYALPKSKVHNCTLNWEATAG